MGTWPPLRSWLRALRLSARSRRAPRRVVHQSLPDDRRGGRTDPLGDVGPQHRPLGRVSARQLAAGRQRLRGRRRGPCGHQRFGARPLSSGDCKRSAANKAPRQERHDRRRTMTWSSARAAIAAFALVLISLNPPPALAENYPTKPITIVVPLGAGTGMDIVVRLYADKLAQVLGKT